MRVCCRATFRLSHARPTPIPSARRVATMRTAPWERSRPSRAPMQAERALLPRRHSPSVSATHVTPMCSTRPRANATGSRVPPTTSAPSTRKLPSPSACPARPARRPRPTRRPSATASARLAATALSVRRTQATSCVAPAPSPAAPANPSFAAAASAPNGTTLHAFAARFYLRLCVRMCAACVLIFVWPCAGCSQRSCYRRRQPRMHGRMCRGRCTH